MQVQQLKVVGIEMMDDGKVVKLKLEGRHPSNIYKWQAAVYLTPSDALGIGFGATFEIGQARDENNFSELIHTVPLGGEQ